MLEPLIKTWRDEVQFFRKRGLEDSAIFLESVIEDAEDYVAEYEGVSLTLTQASEEGGHSVSHLGQLVRDGTIPNAGRPNAPRIARSDVPRKAVPLLPSSPDISRTQIVRSATGEV